MQISGHIPRFLESAEEARAITLKAGQIVVMDNLSSHKSQRVKELIEERGCDLMYLPPYSADLSPIEEAFAKLKGILRKAQACSREDGYRRVTRALKRQGWKVNHKRVLRIMGEESLLCQLKRRFVPTTDSDHTFARYPNLIKDVEIEGLDQVWISQTSPTSGCPPPSVIWQRSWMPTPASVWAGISVGG
jgi:transposase